MTFDYEDTENRSDLEPLTDFLEKGDYSTAEFVAKQMIERLPNIRNRMTSST